MLQPDELDGATGPVETTEAAPAVIYSIKGFDQDLSCRGYKFTVGETYAHDGVVKACRGGFHACTVDAHPLSVFDYYTPAGSRFHEVVQGGATDSGDGIKIASATITIGIEITLGDLVKRAWDYVWSRATKSDDAHVTVDRGAASATGTQGAASATGTQGAASATGYQGAASATGDQGAASATGNQGAASATGNQGAASATGTQGAASATGYQGAASATGTQGAASATGYQGAASATGTQGAASATGYQGAASATGTQGAASATGYQGAASATGTQGAASATGYQGAASATGYQGAASATGDQGAASATGTQGAASATGTQGAAMAPGKDGRVTGAEGCVLFAVERGEWDGRGYPAVSTASGIVGRDGIKAGVWYAASAGNLVEAK